MKSNALKIKYILYVKSKIYVGDGIAETKLPFYKHKLNMMNYKNIPLQYKETSEIQEVFYILFNNKFIIYFLILFYVLLLVYMLHCVQNVV